MFERLFSSQDRSDTWSAQDSAVVLLTLVAQMEIAFVLLLLLRKGGENKIKNMDLREATKESHTETLSAHKSHLVRRSSGRRQQTLAPRRSRSQEEPPEDHAAAAAPGLEVQNQTGTCDIL